MSTQLAPVEAGAVGQARDYAAIMEEVIARGDLSKLSPQERGAYYVATCESMGLNPLTKPFDYLTLNGKLLLYAGRNCADQLRKLHGVSIEIRSAEVRDGLYVVVCRASTPDGRFDESTAAVDLGRLQGEALANALMKAETKAKRRATLSLVGLSLMDETEARTVAGAERVTPPEMDTAPTGTPDTIRRKAHAMIAAVEGAANGEQRRLAQELAAWVREVRAQIMPGGQTEAALKACVTKYNPRRAKARLADASRAWVDQFCAEVGSIIANGFATSDEKVSNVAKARADLEAAVADGLVTKDSDEHANLLALLTQAEATARREAGVEE